MEEFRESKFNSGLAKLEAIRKLRNACHTARFNTDYDLWYKSLLGLYSEFHSRLKKEEEEEVNGLVIQLQNEMYPRTERGLYDNKIMVTTKPDALLFKLELFFGKMERKFKMDLPDNDDPRFAAGM